MDYGTVFVSGDLSRFKALEAQIEGSKESLAKTLVRMHHFRKEVIRKNSQCLMPWKRLPLAQC